MTYDIEGYKVYIEGYKVEASRVYDIEAGDHGVVCGMRTCRSASMSSVGASFISFLPILSKSSGSSYAYAAEEDRRDCICVYSTSEERQLEL
jgi:hypothetical protein